jgi:hypothetical protein
VKTKNRRRLPVLIAAVGTMSVAAAIAPAFAPSTPTPAAVAKVAVTNSHRVGVVRPEGLPARHPSHR